VSVIPAAPPGPLGLSGQADPVDAQLWHFTITNVQGSYLTCYWGDVSETSVPSEPTTPETFQLDHRYAAAGTYTITAHSAQGNQSDVQLTITVAESTYIPPDTTPPVEPIEVAWRPTVDDVAALIRARTKDASGNELGTFTAATRPTDAEVEQLISNGCAKVATLVGWTLPGDAELEAKHLAALWTACEVEQSYWPEQVRSERSPFAQLLAMFEYDVGPFLQYVASLSPAGALGAKSGTMATPSSTVAYAYEWGYGLGAPLSDVVNVGSGGNK
jgi:hypothetical protein